MTIRAQSYSLTIISLNDTGEIVDRFFAAMASLAIVQCSQMVFKLIFARAVGVPVGQRLGGRLAMTLVATISGILFPFWILQAVSECPGRR